MDSQALQQIKDIIDQHDQVTIAVGQQPSLDELAAALSIYLTFTQAGKKVNIVAPENPLVEHSSLVGIDKIQTSIQGTGGDLIVSFPYKEEGEIEKVSYTLDNGFLNIIVKPGEQGFSFSEDDVRYNRGGTLNGLFIAVGAPHLSDLGQLITAESLKNVTVVNIDNKAENENYGNVVLVSPRFSSLSEQVADLLLSLGHDFDIDTAQNLLYGIHAATNNFQQENTSYLAFEIAAILLRKGAKRPNEQLQARSHNNSQRRQNVVSHNVNRQQEQQQQRSFNSRQVNEQAAQDVLDAPTQERRPAQNNAQQQMQRRQQAIRQQLQQEQANQKKNQGAQPQDLGETNPPADWLTPKVYKGSTNIS